MIGRFSYSLIKIKKPEKETDEEKNYRLLLHSKIFSGGVENKHLHFFSKRTIKRLSQLSEITEDKALLKYFEQSQSEIQLTEEEKCLFAILHQGTNKKVDNFIAFL